MGTPQTWAVEDEAITPTYAPNLVHASLDVLIDGEQELLLSPLEQAIANFLVDSACQMTSHSPAEAFGRE